MHFQIGDPVLLDGHPGTIAALVRSDDDPRKVVPHGDRFVRRGDIPERDELSYLVRVAETRTFRARSVGCVAGLGEGSRCEPGPQ